MVELEIDGRKVEVAEGSMVMHAANAAGVYIPHFCYHKKLSIAANCRMCLVEVEKAPKPLPACATPVTNGMKVMTRSERAVKAQQAVMEFLLINHPLDCPICDQGGDCQLQDLAVGYGGSASHHHEEKRVVFHKPMGPLISAEEMARCIHCTRCVRFGQEIAGTSELGMIHRGEHSEIVSFVGRAVESELSGNMIDVCPVGALTSKPFRYSARTWELSRRRSVAGHDSLGSNIVVQVKHDRVMRVVPLENESVNECWLSDRDRFSYEGLNADDRLTRPMIKQDGRWTEVDWQVALAYAGHAIGDVVRNHGADAFGALGAPNATLEELYLLQKLARGLGSDNVDARLRQTDASIEAALDGAPWLGMPIEEVAQLDRILVIGSFLRQDHPLLALRIRDAVKHGAQLSTVHAVAEDLLVPVTASAICAPSAWGDALAAILAALGQTDLPAGSASLDAGSIKAIADSLASGERVGILLGNAAMQHPLAASLGVLASRIARATGGRVGVLGEAANSVGAYVAGATPGAKGAANARALGTAGKTAAQMLGEPLRAYLTLGFEPSLDTAAGGAARNALAKADTVVVLSAYRSDELLEVADCLLPIAPFTETAGCFINCEGRVQSFNGVVVPAGESRPAWKVLRVLGNLLALDGFNFDSAEAVRSEAMGGKEPSLATGFGGQVTLARQPGALERIADIPAYGCDPIVRRAESLQLTRQAAAARARVNAKTLASLGLADGSQARVSAGAAQAFVAVELDDRVADGVVRLAADKACASLGLAGGPVELTAA
ncbi:MAG: NADH-quinone oxidoreductase subunit G [Burkholderiaceae bacterium]|nr:NADH-quinone oxidoreductase subunit G [Burkholderiaceae bacterium]